MMGGKCGIRLFQSEGGSAEAVWHYSKDLVALGGRINFSNLLLAAATSFVMTAAKAADISGVPVRFRPNISVSRDPAFMSTTAGGISTADDEQSVASVTSRQYVNSVIQSLQWIRGPRVVTIDKKAAFSVPAGFLLLKEGDTDRLMKLLQNPIQRQYYFFCPPDFSWYALISYTETGRVLPNEQLDPKAILDSIKANTQGSNLERDASGWGRISVSGWRRLPRFDERTKRLEWAVSAVDSEGVAVTNFNTRILGRTGIVSVDLVVEDAGFEAAISSVRDAMRNLAFLPGERYEDYRDGDPTAKYGVSGLVADGTREGHGATLSGWLVVMFSGMILFAGMVLFGIARRASRGRKRKPTMIDTAQRE
ncbi:putative membrane-anchored protein [Paraburkholderia sp. 35.1]